MRLFDKIRQIERLDYLIRNKATGTPKDLSAKIGISERQVYNIIREMKDLGAPVFFCQFQQSYCYKEEVAFTFGFMEKRQSLRKLVGGGVFMNNIKSLILTR